MIPIYTPKIETPTYELSTPIACIPVNENNVQGEKGEQGKMERVLFFHDNKKLTINVRKIFTFPYLFGQNYLTSITFIIKGSSNVTLFLRDENSDKIYSQINCEKSQLNCDVEQNYNIFSMLDFGDLLSEKNSLVLSLHAKIEDSTQNNVEFISATITM